MGVVPSHTLGAQIEEKGKREKQMKPSIHLPLLPCQVMCEWPYTPTARDRSYSVYVPLWYVEPNSQIMNQNESSLPQDASCQVSGQGD